MNVQLKYIDHGRQNLLETDKIVHVKVIERKGGNSAVIELNGYRTEALIEADVPDNFLAFAEIGAKQADQMSVKLRVLSSFRNSREFSDYNRQKLFDSIKMFLMENNLPLDQVNYENALLLRSAGIKLDPTLLKLLNQASLKNSEEFVLTLIGFMKKNMIMDAEFLDLFFDIRKVLRRLLKISMEPVKAQSDPERTNAKNTLENIYSVFSKVFGEKNDYRAFLLDLEGKELLVQYRTERHAERERYYFELSDEEIGENLLVIDKDQSSFRVNVFMNGDFYSGIKEKISAGKDALRSSLQNRIPDKKLILEFLEMKDPFAFWKDEELTPAAEDGALFNLDISV